MSNDEVEEKYTYLLFELGREIYGVDLLSVREVIEPMPTKVIPNTKEYFIGVINIRGEIVGVIDMRMRYRQKADDGDHKAYMIIETANGPLGAVVDKVNSVASFNKEVIQTDVKIASQLPDEFITGIAKIDERLVTLLDLKKLLENEKISTVSKGLSA